MLILVIKITFLGVDTFRQFTFGQFTFGHLTFGQLLHLGILHYVNFTFRQLIQFVNCDNGLKFGQLSYLKA